MKYCCEQMKLYVEGGCISLKLIKKIQWTKDFSRYNKFQKKYCKYVYEQIRSYHGEQFKLFTIDYLNGDNNCPYYQRKWWKFWVKLGK